MMNLNLIRHCEIIPYRREEEEDRSSIQIKDQHSLLHALIRAEMSETIQLHLMIQNMKLIIIGTTKTANFILVHCSALLLTLRGMGTD